MRISSKNVETGEIHSEIEINNGDWDVLCDSLIHTLLSYMKSIEKIESMLGNYRCKDNGVLLKKWIDYNNEHDLTTGQTFVSTIYSNRSYFMKFLIYYEMVGLFYMLQYGHDEGCFSEGQVHDISETLNHLKHHYTRENTEESTKYYNLLNNLYLFFETANHMQCLVVEYTWDSIPNGEEEYA